MASSPGRAFGFLSTRAAAGLVALALLHLAAGCGRARVAECNKLIGVGNDQQTRIDKATADLQRNTENATAIEALASAMDAAAAAVEGVPLEDQKLKSLQTEYKEMLRRGGRDCREIVAATNAHDVDRAKKAREGLKWLETEEPRLISGVNGYCQGK